MLFLLSVLEEPQLESLVLSARLPVLAAEVIFGVKRIPKIESPANGMNQQDAVRVQRFSHHNFRNLVDLSS